MAEPDLSLDFAYRHCEALVRERDPDRYFATLFAPADKRPHLYALYAFSAEVAHIEEVTREPLTGEIRLQWWRDALNEPEQGAANPVVAALDATITAFNLPRTTFENLIDAHAFDLYSEPMPDINQLEGYCGEICSVLFQVAASILAGKIVDVSEAAGHGGVAVAMTGVIRAFPWHARRGKVYVPLTLLQKHGADIDKITEGGDAEAVKRALMDLRAQALDHLHKAQEGLKALPAMVRPAFLPLTLVRPYLTLLEARTYQPFETILDRAQWRKQWWLWRATRKLG